MNKEPSAASRRPSSRLTGNFGCSPDSPQDNQALQSTPQTSLPEGRTKAAFRLLCRCVCPPDPDVHLSPSCSSAPSSAGENWLQSWAAIKAAGGQALGMVTAKDQTLGNMDGGTSKPPTSNAGPGSKNTCRVRMVMGHPTCASEHGPWPVTGGRWPLPQLSRPKGPPKPCRATNLPTASHGQRSHRGWETPLWCCLLPWAPGRREWQSVSELILRVGVWDRARTHERPEKVGGFKPKCWRAAELCLGRSFIAVSMPATSMASDTGYIHRKDEGKKHLALLIVLMKRRSISLHSKPEQMTLGHHVIQFQDDTVSFSPILFFLMGYRQTHVGFPTPTGFLAWSKLLSEPNNQSKPRIKCSSPRRDLSEAGLALTSQWLPPGQASYNLGSKYHLF